MHAQTTTDGHGMSCTPRITIRCMTAKGKLLQQVPTWTEREAEIALRAVGRDGDHEPEMAPLPEGWGETLTGEPMPNIVVALRCSRDSH